MTSAVLDVFPVNVTTASPKCEVAPNTILVALSTVAFTFVVVIVDKSTSRSSSTFVILIVPAPLIVLPDTTATSAFTVTPVGICNSFTPDISTSTAVPVVGVKVNSVLPVFFVTVTAPLPEPTSHTPVDFSVTTGPTGLATTGAVTSLAPPHAVKGSSNSGNKFVFFFVAILNHFFKKASRSAPAGILISSISKLPSDTKVLN